MPTRNRMQVLTTVWGTSSRETSKSPSEKRELAPFDAEDDDMLMPLGELQGIGRRQPREHQGQGYGEILLRYKQYLRDRYDYKLEEQNVSDVPASIRGDHTINHFFSGSPTSPSSVGTPSSSNGASEGAVGIMKKNNADETQHVPDQEQSLVTTNGRSISATTSCTTSAIEKGDKNLIAMLLQENSILQRRLSKLEDDAAAEEHDSMGLENFSQRISWLVGLLMLQSASSAILASFHVLLQFHPVVIYFLTMLVGAGGNCGAQSAMLVIRELVRQKTSATGDRSLTLNKSGKVVPRVDLHRISLLVRQQASIGLKMGLICAVAAFVRCCLFHGTLVDEAFAIAVSMFCIVLTSACVGAALPLGMAYYGIDPAHAGAAIQVIMDITGVALTCLVSTIILFALEREDFGKSVISPIVKKHSQVTLPHPAESTATATHVGAAPDQPGRALLAATTDELYDSKNTLATSAGSSTLGRLQQPGGSSRRAAFLPAAIFDQTTRGHR
ncbi:unnamed protein product [Amoebophrya sp. A25]|nr:unnamed protein product [Amoebophrya sp. A25]|eukprot:GSA25T00010869001.1